MDWKAESASLRQKWGMENYEPLQPFVAERTVDRSIWYEGQLMTVYAEGEQTGNSCCVWEGNIPEEVGPPPHVHHYEHEMFFVLEGSITAWVDGTPFDSTKDSLIFVPAGRIHWFVSTSPVTRMLSLTVTAYHEFPTANTNVDLFKFIGRPAEALTLPPLDDPLQQMPDPVEITRVTHELGSDMPDLERFGWRRGFRDIGD